MLSYFKKSFSYLKIALNQVMHVCVGGGGCSVLKRGSEIVNCGKQHGAKVATLHKVKYAIFVSLVLK